MTDYQIEQLIRTDRDLITEIIPEDSHVLDLGCGDGSLLARLIETKGVEGCGIDIDEHNLIRCVERGLSVSKDDLDEGLGDFLDNSYDYVILNQTLQVIKKPDIIIKEMLRVGKFGIVGFPNFGHWFIRMSLLMSGRIPKSRVLPFSWYNTPNIHPLTICDFKDFCQSENIAIIHEEYFIAGKWRHSSLWHPFENLLALYGMFVLKGQ